MPRLPGRHPIYAAKAPVYQIDTSIRRRHPSTGWTPLIGPARRITLIYIRRNPTYPAPRPPSPGFRDPFVAEATRQPPGPLCGRLAFSSMPTQLFHSTFSRSAHPSQRMPAIELILLSHEIKATAKPTDISAPHVKTSVQPVPSPHPSLRGRLAGRPLTNKRQNLIPHDTKKKPSRTEPRSIPANSCRPTDRPSPHRRPSSPSLTPFPLPHLERCRLSRLCPIMILRQPRKGFTKLLHISHRQIRFTGSLYATWSHTDLLLRHPEAAPPRRPRTCAGTFEEKDVQSRSIAFKHSFHKWNKWLRRDFLRFASSTLPVLCCFHTFQPTPYPSVKPLRGGPGEL